MSAYFNDLKSFSQDDFIIKYWHEKRIRNFISTNYGPELLGEYDVYIPYAYKSDVARIAILNKLGGWYADLGIKKLADFKVVEDANLFICRDNHTINQWSVDHSFQNSLIYSTPNNPYLSEVLDQMILRAAKKEYGFCYHDVTGPIFLANIYYNGSWGNRITAKIGEAGPLRYENRILYSIDDTPIALFKDEATSKRKLLKKIRKS